MFLLTAKESSNIDFINKWEFTSHGEIDKAQIQHISSLW